MSARLREEMLAGASPRQAVAEAVRHVAPAIAAAGLVLAITVLLGRNAWWPGRASRARSRFGPSGATT
jgi:uncharacterized membrane protein YdfJ with MMPL/SSD domain